VLAQEGDLGVLLDSGDEENDDGGGESHETDGDDDTPRAADVDLHAGPPKSHDGLCGRLDATRAHLGVPEVGLLGAIPSAAAVSQAISHTSFVAALQSPGDPEIVAVRSD